MADFEERGAQNELLRAAALASIASIAAFLWYLAHNQVLLYGDAVAHINIARRVFDSRDPSPVQLGTVWLPLPHVLMLPFVVNDAMWRSGIGGSIPSMLAYVLGAVGVFRLVRGRSSRAAAWTAFALFAFNPSLLYMQSTAMTESIFLCAMVWSLVYLDEMLRGLFPERGGGLPARLKPSIALGRCGVALGAAIFTRYDGWILAFAVGTVALLAVILSHVFRSQGRDERLGRVMIEFLLLCALCPTLWLAHNYSISRHPLDWWNGPYSAKAIEQRTTRPGDPPYPGKYHMLCAAKYFAKCARMQMAEGGAEWPLFLLAIGGVALAATRPLRMAALLLLWLPLPFYAYSIAYGSVPIFIPVWWPYSYYNVRYGLELLPAMAVSIGLVVGALWRVESNLLLRRAAYLVFALAVWGYASSWRGDSHFYRGLRVHTRGPICLREAIANGEARMQAEWSVAQALKKLPPHSILMMNTGTHVGALQFAGVHLSRTVNESTFIAWDAARSAPAAVVDYAIAWDDDDVARAVRQNPHGLKLEERLTFRYISASILRSEWRTH